MNSVLEQEAPIFSRENMYQLLGHLFKAKVDQPLLEHLQGMSFPVKCGDDELAEGYLMLADYLRKPGTDPLTDMAKDFSSIFSCAGSGQNNAVCPHESAYTSQNQTDGQKIREHVAAIYSSKGLGKDSSVEIPEDHISVELEFIAYLCHEAEHFTSEKNWPAMSKCIQDLKNFLAQHLLNWAPALCADVEKRAETNFYKAVAKITNGFLRLELSIVDELLKNTNLEAAGVDPQRGCC